MNFSQDTISYLKNLKSSFCNNNNEKSLKKQSQQTFNSLYFEQKKQARIKHNKDLKININFSKSSTDISNKNYTSPTVIEKITNKKNSFSKFLKKKINCIRSLSIERQANRGADKLKYADKIFQIFNPAVLSELNDIINSPNIETLKYILPYLLLENYKKETVVERLKSLKCLQGDKKDFNKQENAVLNKKVIPEEIINDKKVDSKHNDNNRFSLQNNNYYLKKDKKNFRNTENVLQAFSDDSLNMKQHLKTSFHSGENLCSTQNVSVKKKFRQFSEISPDYFSLKSKNSYTSGPQISSYSNNGNTKNILLKRDNDCSIMTNDLTRQQLDNLKIDIPSNEKIVCFNKNKLEKKLLNYETPTCKINHSESFRNWFENSYSSNEIPRENSYNFYLKNNIDFENNQMKAKIVQSIPNSRIQNNRIILNHNNSTNRQSTIENSRDLKDLIIFDNPSDKMKQNSPPEVGSKCTFFFEKKSDEKINERVIQNFKDLDKRFAYESAHSTDTFHSAKTNSEKEIEGGNPSLLRTENQLRLRSKSRESIAKRNSCRKSYKDRNSEAFSNIPFCLDLAKSSEENCMSYHRETSSNESRINEMIKNAVNEKSNFNKFSGMWQKYVQANQGTKIKDSSEISNINIDNQRFVSHTTPNYIDESLIIKNDELKKERKIARFENKKNISDDSFSHNICKTESLVTSVSTETSIRNTIKEVTRKNYRLNTNKLEKKINSLLIPYNDLLIEENTDISSTKSASFNEVSDCDGSLSGSNILKNENYNSTCKQLQTSHDILNNFIMNHSNFNNDEPFNLSLLYEKNLNSNQSLDKLKKNILIENNEFINPNSNIVEDNSEKHIENDKTCISTQSLVLLNFKEESNAVNNIFLNSNNNCNIPSLVNKNESTEINQISLALLEIDQKYKADIYSKKRPFEVELMNNEQLTEEKSVLENFLFQLEWNFGWNTLLYENENFVVLKKRYELVRKILEGLQCKSCGLRYHFFND